MTDEATKRGGWLGRVIVVLVVWVALAAGAYYVLIVMLGGRAAPQPTPSDAPTARAPVDWTPQAIEERPAAFLEAAITRSRNLAAARQQRLDEVTRRRNEVNTRAEELQQSLMDVQNVHDRLGRAYRNAEDEDRWPVRFAGRSFDRAKAQSILDETERYLDSRRPAADAYRTVLTEFAAAEAKLRADVDTLARLVERLQLDLERVRLDAKSVAAVELGRVDEQLDAMDRAAAGGDTPASPAVEAKSGESFLE